MQFGSGGKPPLGILFDCSMGERIDEVLALCLLYGFDGKNECRVSSISVTKANLKAAALADAIGRFYAGEVSAAFAAFSRTLPVGLATDGYLAADTPMLAVTAKHKHSVNKLVDTAEPSVVLRNALTAQQDGNCAMVSTGSANNLARLLDLHASRQWIESKPKVLVLAIADPGSARSTRKVLAEWPGPVVVIGPEVGEAVPFPAASIEKDFAWSPAHPAADAYRAAKAMPYDAPTTALAAVLYAVKPEGYFTVSESGTASIDDSGQLRFAPGAGKHKRLSVDPANAEKIRKVYTEMASAKPVQRQRRTRPPQQQQQTPPPKVETPKPPAP